MVDKNDYGVHPGYQFLNLFPVSSKLIYLSLWDSSTMTLKALILEGQSPSCTEAPTKM